MNSILCSGIDIIHRKQAEHIDGPYTSLSKMTERLCKRAGLEKFGLHQLRHLSSVILKNDAKMSIAQLQQFLRHSQLRITEIYAGFLESSTQVQADYLGEFWSEKLNGTGGD